MPKHIALAYIDILTVLFATFFAIVLFMSDDVSKAKANIQDVSQFLMTIEWSKDSQSDVDLFLEDANGEVINFQHKVSKLGNIDVDDMGVNKVDVIRKEVVSIKTLKAGRYVFNALLYRQRDTTPVKVRAQAIKLQPFGSLCEQEFDLGVSGDEHTICSFVIDDSGKVLSVDKTTQEGLVR